MHRIRILGALLCSVAATGATPASAQSPAPPPNDLLAAATPIEPATIIEASNRGAGTEEYEPAPVGRPIGKSVWFALTPREDSLVAVDTCQSNFDTLLGVYRQEGTGVSGLVPVAEDDDSCATNSGSSTSARLAAGITYYLQVGGYGSGEEAEEGAFVLRVASKAPPSNDAFASATVLTGDEPAEDFDVEAATTEVDEPAHLDDLRPSVWFRWTPSTTAEVFASCQPAYDAAGVSVYTGTTLASLTGVAEGNCDTPWTAVAGTTYSIAVSGTGSGRLVIARGGFAVLEHFDLGSQPIGTIGGTRTLTLVNDSTAEVYVQSVTLAGPDRDDVIVGASTTCAEAFTIVADDECRLGLRYAPSQAGAADVHLELSYRFNGGRSYSRTIVLRASGLAAPVGPTGPVGPAGATGATGADGVQGPSGPAGVDGSAGLPGPQGSAGANGAAGRDGAPGPAGPVGPAGSQGPAGRDGVVKCRTSKPKRPKAKKVKVTCSPGAKGAARQRNVRR